MLKKSFCIALGHTDPKDRLGMIIWLVGSNRLKAQVEPHFRTSGQLENKRHLWPFKQSAQQSAHCVQQAANSYLKKKKKIEPAYLGSVRLEPKAVYVSFNSTRLCSGQEKPDLILLESSLSLEFRLTSLLGLLTSLGQTNKIPFHFYELFFLITKNQPCRVYQVSRKEEIITQKKKY